eukprot:TRINITY_DN1813_c0_g1_i2.p1 TRINITY_DN1813_c0_g1~~TRINITY_DN1813_c0_g1_i2.p1  ORF type:complete len:621 (+),score=76.98 TRINITY_DN1813_c0_g1_i2:36-1898(+)
MLRSAITPWRSTAFRSRRPFSSSVNNGKSQCPPLPLPAVRDTCSRYVKTVSPLLKPEERAQTTHCVDEFIKSGDADDLQSQLELLAVRAEKRGSSWLDGWWDTMYREIRCPIPVHVNPYFLFTDDVRRRSQVARAAGIATSFAHYAHGIFAGTLPPEMAGPETPLDPHQRFVVLGSSRIPRPGRDDFVHQKSAFQSHGDIATHAIVLFQSHFYRLAVLNKDKTPRQEGDVARDLDWIMKDARSLGNPSAGVGALTGGSRDRWTSARQSLLSCSKTNQDTLGVVDNALFALCLDSNGNFATLKDVGQNMLTGDAGNRWFDKCTQAIVLEDGRCGVNMEHTGFDGHAMLGLAAFSDEYLSTTSPPFSSSASTATSDVRRLEWVVPNDVANAISQSAAEYAELVGGTASALLDFDTFGKDELKKHRISPDAVVQMGFQLAYFRSFGRFDSTYEPVMMKHFQSGRTETARTLTADAVRFVETVVSESGSAEARSSALRVAAQSHGDLLNQCRTGNGVDRHMFGLLSLAQHQQRNLSGYDIPQLFRDPSYSKCMTSVLSTSSCGGRGIRSFGFGPVCENGLGLGYSITNNAITVHCTSFTKPVDEYAEQLSGALNTIMDILRAEG